LAVIHHDRRDKKQLDLCDVETNTTREFCKIRGFAADPVYSRNGRRLALAEHNPHGVGVWDVATGKEVLRFAPPGLIGGTLDFDPTGDVLAVLGAVNPPQQIYYVRISTGKAPEGWTVPAVSDFNWVRFSPDGSSILFGGRKSIQWCDPKTGKVTFAADGWAATPPAFSVDGRFVAAGGENAIRIWDVSSGKPTAVHKQDTGDDEVHGLAVSPDGKWFVTKHGGTGTLQVWDAAGQLKSDIKSLRWGGRYPLFSRDGKHLFIGAADEVVVVRRDFPDGKETLRYTFDEPAADHISIYHIGLSADGKRLAAFTQTSNRGGAGAPGRAGGPGGRGGEVATLTVWDVSTGRRLASRPFDSSYTMTSGLFGYGAFTPDLRWYFSGEKAIALTDDADLRLELPAGWSFPRQAAISPDGRLVAQVIGEPKGKDRQVEWKRIFVHEASTGKLVATLPAGFCGPIAFTPDSRALITTNPDAITRWDLATQLPVVQHKSPAPFTGSYGNSFASSLIVTPDGTRAITGQRDTTALVWDIKAPGRETRELSKQDVAAAWDDLGGPDAEKAYIAVWALAKWRGNAVPFLRARLRPATAPSDKQATELIAKLDATAFATREAAEKELRGFGDTALPALRAALKGKLSSEQRERVERLVSVATNAVPTDELLQQLRAVAALEHAGTAEAKAILKDLAGGAAGGRLTLEASAALERSR
jgi:WD40 repeat protein